MSRAVVVLLVLAVVLARALAVRSFPIYDDAFITFRYAQNLAAGHGLTYNPGAEWEPVLGNTTPGNAVLLAFCVRLGADVVGASLAINAICDAASAWLVARLCGARSIATAVALAAFAVAPEIARVSVGGMEAPLFLCLALAATATAQASWLVASGTFSALACTVRPEGTLLVVALAAFHLRSWRDLLHFAAPVLLIGSLYAGALTCYFGDPIPQSVKAKAEFYGLGPRLARAAGVLLQAFAPSWPARALAPLALLGFALAFTWRSAARAFVAFALALTTAYAISGAKTWGWYFYAPLAAWCLALGLACEALFDFVARAQPSWARWRTPIAAVAAVASVAAVAAWSRAVTDRVTPLAYEPMRAWARTEQVAERGASICASDIGAIGFYSGARILDSEGLVWPAGRRFERQVDLVREHLPEYVMLVVNRARTPPFLGDPIAARYEPVARFNARNDGNLAPDLAALPDRWEQDYLMLRRRSSKSGN